MVLQRVNIWESCLFTLCNKLFGTESWRLRTITSSLVRISKQGKVVVSMKFPSELSLALIHSVFQRRQWHSTPELLPGKSHGWRSLVGYSPWGRWESDRTEQLHFHFSLLCIGEGNGNPLQCSCLENPRDRGAWWAAVYGVVQSRAQLKRLSSSSPLFQCHFLKRLPLPRCIFLTPLS